MLNINIKIPNTLKCLLYMCETVWSISGVSVRALKVASLSTRGLGRTHLWCTSYSAKSKRWVAMCGVDNCWRHLSRKPNLRWMLSAFIATGHSKISCLIGIKCKVSNDLSWDTLIGLVSLIFFCLYKRQQNYVLLPFVRVTCSFEVQLLKWVYLLYSFFNSCLCKNYVFATKLYNEALQNKVLHQALLTG